eukprot:jgi/Botrbrau1/6472/Bobra.0034s0046.1
MPIGGQITLKGGIPLGVKAGTAKKKKKKKVDSEAVEGTVDQELILSKDGKPISAASVSVQSGKAYEQEFALEMEKAKEGKVKNTPWGSSYRAPPKILHGYSAPVTGKTAEERLDLRCAVRGDKFCK